MTEENVTEAKSGDVTTGEETAAPSLKIRMVEMAVRCIDLAVEQGGYKGNQIQQVGAVRDSLAEFVRGVAVLSENSGDTETNDGEKKAE